MKSESRRPGLGSGSHVDPTSRRAEPSEYASKPQPAADDAIAVFVPWAGADELALRRRIQRAHGAAAARAARSRHGRARALWWWSSQLAADWTFARAPIDDLQEIIAALSRAFLIANAVERLEAPDAE